MGPGLLHASAGPSLTSSSASLQFQKDAKDAQELLKKVDTDLDQKFSPEFKDRYQLESLLRELDVSIGAGRTEGEAVAGAGVPAAPKQGRPCRSRHLTQLSAWRAAGPCCHLPLPGLHRTLPSPRARARLSRSNVIAGWVGFYLFSH